MIEALPELRGKRKRGFEEMLRKAIDVKDSIIEHEMNLFWEIRTKYERERILK